MACEATMTARQYASTLIHHFRLTGLTGLCTFSIAIWRCKKNRLMSEMELHGVTASYVEQVTREKQNDRGNTSQSKEV